MERKYEFTDETKGHYGRTLHRIVAVRDFGNVKAGDKGGWIEKESNLCHYDNCWVGENAMVFGEARVIGSAQVYENALVGGYARVYENARVFRNAQVFGCAQVFGNAQVFGCAQLCGDARVYGSAEVCGNAIVGSDEDYIVFKNWWSSGRYFTWTRSNNLWAVGCFHGTGEELIRKAYCDSEESGREYERIVRYVEEILKAEEE